MKILSSGQIQKADQYTIKNEPIASINLMERASKAFVAKFLGLHPEKQEVFIFSGTGNNGGDGLAIARLLIEGGWKANIFVVGNSEKGSEDFKINLAKLASYNKVEKEGDFPKIPSNSIIIDGLFGSGLSRQLDGLYKILIEYLNRQKALRVAIDISSGLYADKPLSKETVAFEADFTISFQLPKLAFFLPECERYVGKWRVVDIGLDKDFIQDQPSNFHFTEKSDLEKLIPSRSTYTHKNKVGRLMIVAGRLGKMGAAILCARGAFRTGAGVVNIHAPKCGIDILQVGIPEAMVSVDKGKHHISAVPATNDTIALGPGLGTEEDTARAVEDLLAHTDVPMVIDADGINILAKNKHLIQLLPHESILTPHPGEFKRLVGEWENDFDKLDKLRAFCRTSKLNVVLKGAFSAICDSSGMVYFNPTGNPALATAGSGDVLTGMTGALLAQGLNPFDALKLAAYLHGSAGDEAVRALQTPWIQASDIIDFIPHAESSLKNY